jgi:hypothetical protein
MVRRVTTTPAPVRTITEGNGLAPELSTRRRRGWGGRCRVVPGIGDRVQYDGRSGTVVDVRSYRDGTLRWLVIEYDAEAGHLPGKTWVACADVPSLEVIAQSRAQSPLSCDGPER